MEVKMFVCNNPHFAEKEVNDWLSKHKVDVCHITQSQGERGGNFLFVISVFYVRGNSYGQGVVNQESFKQLNGS